MLKSCLFHLTSETFQLPSMALTTLKPVSRKLHIFVQNFLFLRFYLSEWVQTCRTELLRYCAYLFNMEIFFCFLIVKEVRVLQVSKNVVKILAFWKKIFCMGNNQYFKKIPVLKYSVAFHTFFNIVVLTVFEKKKIIHMHF